MKNVILSLMLVFCSAIPSFAQTGALTNIRIDFFAVGVDPAVGKPIQTTTIPFAAWLCNQAPFPAIPPANLTNPTGINWSDPALPARLCVVNNNAVLIGLPISAIQYFATGVFTNDFGLSSPRSAESNPFLKAVVPVAPVAPVGLQVR